MKLQSSTLVLLHRSTPFVQKVKAKKTIIANFDFLLVIHNSAGLQSSESLPQKEKDNLSFILSHISAHPHRIHFSQQSTIDQQQLENIKKGFIIFSPENSWNILGKKINFKKNIDFKQGKTLFVLKAPSLASEDFDKNEIITFLKK